MRVYASKATGRQTVKLQAYRDARGLQVEVVRESWNVKRTHCSRSVLMTSDLSVAFTAFRQA